MQQYTTIKQSDAQRLETIFRIMNDKTFGLRAAERIVGGRARLMRLIVDGRIRATKGNQQAQNGKWLCNAADVLRNAYERY